MKTATVGVTRIAAPRKIEVTRDSSPGKLNLPVECPFDSADLRNPRGGKVQGMNSAYGLSCPDHRARCRSMPICPICEKNVSVFHWDIFGGSCTACTGIAPDSLAEILSQECGQCNGRNIFATTAPALTYTRTKNGVVPSKTAPGLFLIGCSDCGHAWFKFNAAGAASIATAPGWLGNAQLKKRRGETSFECPKCGQSIDLTPPSGIRISDEVPRRIYCERCNEEISHGGLQ